MILFTYRPSPQIPQPSPEVTLRCYDSSVKAIQLQKKMYDEKSIDYTWVYIHQISNATLTLIWSLYSEDVRKLHPKEEFERNLDISLTLLTALAERWPGTEAAGDLFARLGQAALQSYSGDGEKNHPKPPSAAGSHSNAGSPPPSLSTSLSTPNRHSPPYTYDNSSIEESTPSPRASSTATSYTPTYSTGFQPLDDRMLKTEPNQSPPGLGLPDLQDLQSLMFNSTAVYNLFPVGGSSIPAFMSSWDPASGFAATGAPGMGTLVAMHTSMGAGIDTTNVLNQQQQQNELLNILQNESIQGFEAPRQWIPDFDNPHFY